jgi:hypothetical protein
MISQALAARAKPGQAAPRPLCNIALTMEYKIFNTSVGKAGH